MIDERLEKLRLTVIAIEFNKLYPATYNLVIEEIGPNYESSLIGQEIENRFPVACGKMEQKIDRIVDAMMTYEEDVATDKYDYLRPEI